jgi:hypothetical protein
MNYKLPHLAVWLLLWKISIFIGFGSLWIILTLFSVMFMNLGERKPGELSAYSVFNDGFTKILGTISPEQFENEIRHAVLDANDEHDDDLVDDDDNADGIEDRDNRNHRRQLIRNNNVNGRGGGRRRGRHRQGRDEELVAQQD